MSNPTTPPALAPGLEETFAFVVPETKTVPHLYPESAEFQRMPQVFATGFMVGLVEWACIRAIHRGLADASALSVGTDVKLSHVAPTPPGLTVTVRVRVTAVDGRKVSFAVTAHDGVDEICAGTHERHLIDGPRFEAKVARKRERSGWVAATPARGTGGTSCPRSRSRSRRRG